MRESFGREREWNVGVAWGFDKGDKKRRREKIGKTKKQNWELSLSFFFLFEVLFVCFLIKWMIPLIFGLKLELRDHYISLTLYINYLVFSNDPMLPACSFLDSDMTIHMNGCNSNLYSLN